MMIAISGPTYVKSSFASVNVGMRMVGRRFFRFRVRNKRKPQLKTVENAVAAAAPAHPQRRGQTHRRKSPITLMTAAIPMTLRGEIASRVASNIERETFCDSAAHAILPLQ